MANNEYREPHQTAREIGLAKRHETRQERADEKLIEAAYAAKRDRILAYLDAEVREREGWIRLANSEVRAFWATLRGRGIPDRPAEREAYKRLAADIREIGTREASND